jgi:hypothetical protein
MGLKAFDHCPRSVRATDPPLVALALLVVPALVSQDHAHPIAVSDRPRNSDGRVVARGRHPAIRPDSACRGVAAWRRADQERGKR